MIIMTNMTIITTIKISYTQRTCGKLKAHRQTASYSTLAELVYWVIPLQLDAPQVRMRCHYEHDQRHDSDHAIGRSVCRGAWLVSVIDCELYADETPAHDTAVTPPASSFHQSTASARPHTPLVR